MGIAGFPQEFADRAATILGHGLEVSVTMRQAGVSVRAGSSTEAAARCDQAEALDGRGPCIDAMDHGGRRVIASVADAPGGSAGRASASRRASSRRPPSPPPSRPTSPSRSTCTRARPTPGRRSS